MAVRLDTDFLSAFRLRRSRQHSGPLGRLYLENIEDTQMPMNEWTSISHIESVARTRCGCSVVGRTLLELPIWRKEPARTINTLHEIDWLYWVWADELAALSVRKIFGVCRSLPSLSPLGPALLFSHLLLSGFVMLTLSKILLPFQP